MKEKAVLGALLSWFAWQAAVPVNLALADIGRHIKNGELLLSGVWDILWRNYYSYTHPDLSFINHHWLFGVLSYGIWRAADFTGLSIFYLAVQMTAVGVFFYLARKHASLMLSSALVLLALPFAAYRSEIRPEGISVLFCGVVWWLLKSRERGAFRLTVLVLCQVIWVNTHIFFFMGPLLAVLWAIEARLNKRAEEFGFLLKASVFMVAACLINPSGVAGAFLPLRGLEGFGLELVENQPISFMVEHFKKDEIYWYFFAAVSLTGTAFILLFLKEGLRPHVMMGFLMLVMSLAAFKGVRLLGPYGYFWIPLSAYALGHLLKHYPLIRQKQAAAVLLLAGMAVALTVNPPWQKKTGIGLEPEINASAEFFKSYELKGPVLNNYDIGGYLIFHFAPQMKFFTDNRQEAYPAVFFKNTMTPMLFDEEAWQAEDARRHFNVIFFSRNPWEKAFLLKRYYDPEWALVYRDDHAVIMVRRNALNKAVIDAFETPVGRPSAS